MLTAEELTRLPLYTAMAVSQLEVEGFLHRCDRCHGVVVLEAPKTLWPRLRKSGFVARHACDTKHWELAGDARWVEETPEPGMPMTYSINGDRHPGEVTRVERKGSWVFYRLAKQLDEWKAALLQDGTYKPVDRCGSVFFGRADSYLDPHF